MGVSEGAEAEKGAERISEEIMAENFPNLVKYMTISLQEAQVGLSPRDPTKHYNYIFKSQR